MGRPVGDQHVGDELTRLARGDASRVLSLLADRFGVDVADDAVQEAMIQATRVWPERGVPANPAGWLMVAARRKAIDRIRADQADRERASAAAALRVHDGLPVSGGAGDLIDDTALGATDPEVARRLDGPDAPSSQLRLMLLCAHPALDPDTRVALTLRLVGGLSTAEIAAAYLVPEATLAQRIVRAKRKIRTAGIPMTLPTAIEERLDELLRVLYLVFNEGYLSSSPGATPVRTDLAAEAIRLTELLCSLLPEQAEPLGLLALQLFQGARAVARLDDDGGLRLLEEQDRSRWDQTMIARGNEALRAAMSRMQPGPYQVQALIAAEHAAAAQAAGTNWPRIVMLYGQLEAMTDSDIVRMNQAVAVAMVEGPDAGLAVLDRLASLEGQFRLHAVRAELLGRAGRRGEAGIAFDRALALRPPPADAALLRRRRATIIGEPP